MAKLRVQALLVLLMAPALASATPTGLDTTAEEFEAKLGYQQGKIELGSGLATLELGPAFRYLDPEQTERVLVKAWGNPPGNKTLGMILPADVGPLQEGGWAVVVTYEEDGYVDDSGAEKLDYTKLLDEMQDGTKEANKARAKEGYEPVELVGWAESPTYDKPSHKLYWAKELKFGDRSEHTLNYNIRVLGRRGVLVLNAVADMNQLPTIKQSMQTLLPEVEFNQGHKYTDFIPGTDGVAKYGIGALVVGALAAKTGLFKVLLAGLLAFKKVILVGLLGAGAALRKMFAKKAPDASGPIGPSA